MALQDTWKDLIDHESLVQASDINSIANAVIDIEKAKADGTIINKEAVVKALDYTPADEETVSKEFGTETLETESQTVKGAINELKRTSSLAKIINNASGEMITLKDATNDYYESITIYGKSTQDGTPTPEAPVPIVSVGDDGTVGVTSCGKNLIPYPYANSDNKVSNGITWKVNADRSVTANGTATGASYFVFLQLDTPIEVTKQLVFSGCPSGGSESSFGLHVWETVSEVIANFGGNVIVPTGTKYKEIYAFIREGYTANNLTFKPQLELGTTATPYEPYKGTTATLTTALPLCSAGDVRDEGIFNADGTGKVVKRIGIVDIGTCPWTKREGFEGVFYTAVSGRKAGELNLLTSMYKTEKGFGNWSIVGNSINTLVYITDSNYTDAATLKTAMSGVMLYYELATPEEIDLTAEEVAALKSLMSYRGTTNVFNDGGSEMEIEYTADMKAYIDGILGVGG